MFTKYAKSLWATELFLSDVYPFAKRTIIAIKNYGCEYDFKKIIRNGLYVFTADAEQGRKYRRSSNQRKTESKQVAKAMTHA
jgi:hypothetical protein